MIKFRANFTYIRDLYGNTSKFENFKVQVFDFFSQYNCTTELVSNVCTCLPEDYIILKLAHPGAIRYEIEC